MSALLLGVITVGLVLTLLIGAVNFPLVPAFFGIYGRARQEARGKVLMRLLWFYPIFTLACLAVAWGSVGSVLSYVALLPFVYVGSLWSMRANKQDSSASEKRFSTTQENMEEQVREMDYKWHSWAEALNDECVLRFEAWLPNASMASELQQALVKSKRAAGDFSVEKDSDGSVMLHFAAPLESKTKTAIRADIKGTIDVIWQYSGELSSSEIETR